MIMKDCLGWGCNVKWKFLFKKTKTKQKQMKALDLNHLDRVKNMPMEYVCQYNVLNAAKPLHDNLLQHDITYSVKMQKIWYRSEYELTKGLP